MNVNEIRDRILEVSHDEVAPDTNLQNKAISWLNSAYHEMMDECMPFMERYLQKSELVEVESGLGSLNQEVYRAVQVVDIQNKRALKEVSYQEILAKDPALEVKGAPACYYLQGNQISVYPAQNTSLKVVYMPVVSDLSEGQVESDILLPRVFHGGLVWGGLVWGSVFERGFSSASDMKLFQAKWDAAKTKVKLSLSSNSQKELRVKPFDTV